jgi:hypothetical protein
MAHATLLPRDARARAFPKLRLVERFVNLFEFWGVGACLSMAWLVHTLLAHLPLNERKGSLGVALAV